MSNAMSKNIALGNRVHEMLTLWEEGAKVTKNGFLMMGQAIYLIKQEKLWRYDGTPTYTFKYWCENTLHISLPQANRLAQVYAEVGHLLTSIDIDISKITVLLPYLHDKTDEEKKSMLTMASVCKVEDIKNNILEIRGEKSKATDVCGHDIFTVWNRCDSCGKFFK